VKRFQGRVADLIKTTDDALHGAKRKAELRGKLNAIKGELTVLDRETVKGVSRADEERLGDVERRLGEAAGGVKSAPAPAPVAAAPVVDADDDGRTGTEATLIYRGQTYAKMPGWDHPPTYGRIDDAKLGLPDDVLDTYQKALEKGKIAANERGKSGVKQKPMAFEIKLRNEVAGALGVGRDWRLDTNSKPHGETQASSGIRYLVFDDQGHSH
jgi:hypothetical protein